MVEESMGKQDTKDLLQECNAGCKMATDSIEQILDYVDDATLKKLLEGYNEDHVRLGEEIHSLLNEYDLEEEDPSMMSKAMATISTSVKMMMNREEKEIAKIMMDGCNMGIQSLGKYLNQYALADEKCKKLAQKLIDSEFQFMKKMVAYL